jgi:hypothetical protein
MKSSEVEVKLKSSEDGNQANVRALLVRLMDGEDVYSKLRGFRRREVRKARKQMLQRRLSRKENPNKCHAVFE